MIIVLAFGHHLLPPWWLHTTAYGILMVFVAINTIMYGALSVAKVFPALHPTEWLPRKRRSETRSIYPDGEADQPPGGRHRAEHGDEHGDADGDAHRDEQAAQPAPEGDTQAGVD